MIIGVSYLHVITFAACNFGGQTTGTLYRYLQTREFCRRCCCCDLSLSALLVFRRKQSDVIFASHYVDSFLLGFESGFVHASFVFAHDS